MITLNARNLRALAAALREDLDVVIAKDPSIHSRLEAGLHPHITALWLYRLANACYRRSHRVPARLLGLLGRFFTGIEIHPGATIGRRFFIDHGAAVVIGETAEIGDDVMLYHQVTLGSVGWWKDKESPSSGRHPRLGNDVIIGTNASVLGAITVGHGSRIGAHSVLTTSVPAHSRVAAAHATVAQGGDRTEILITGEVTGTRDRAGKAAKKKGMATMESSARKKYVITSAPPNPNGDLHLGHLSGPFLGADVLRRFLVQQGHEARYVSYVDDYSCYVRRRGEALGHTTERTAYTYGHRMEETLALGQMLPDHFSHPLNQPLHTELTQRFFLELWEKDAIVERELPTFYCGHCEQYLYEAEVTGTCQFCEAQSGGLECEQCARRQDTTGLRDPRCITCGERPEVRPLRRLVFPLEPHRAGLERFAAGGTWRPRLAAFLRETLSRPLPEVPFSRLDPLGITVPLPGWEGHVVDTWFGGIWGYLAATTAHATGTGDPATGEQIWRDPGTEMIHFLGQDCSFSHAVFWPGLLLAQGEMHLPAHVITNEFYRLDGEKFSTSRGHAIWGGEFLRLTPSDAVRFHLCLAGPETESTSFSLREFTGSSREVLRDSLQNWTDELLMLVYKDFGGVVPEPGDASPDPRVAAALRLPALVAEALAPETFSLRRAAEAVRDVVLELPESLVAARAMHGTERAAAVSDQVEALARLAAAVAPLMPSWSGLVLAALSVPSTDSLERTPPWPVAGRRLVPPGRYIADACPTALSTLT